MNILPENIHASWHALLDEPTRNILQRIETQLREPVNPPANRMLRFLSMDLSRIKVVILGQDPYPEAGMATGRAFEVGGLTSWQHPFRQVSLKNMVRLLSCNTKGVRPWEGEVEYAGIPSFTQLKQEMETGAFHLLPPDRLFQSWADQGVLLLNTWFSVLPGEPGSHREIWEPFSERVIRFLASEWPDLIWFLWGSPAQSRRPLIGKARVYCSRHPMMCSSKYPDDFLKNRCFFDTQSMIQWTGEHGNA